MKYTLIDYGVGNIRSVIGALNNIEVNLQIHDRGKLPMNTCGIIIPGVARYKAGLSNLHERKLFDEILSGNARNLPILGLCLGAQMLGRSSEEDPDIAGLSIVDMKCTVLNEANSRVPFQGWRKLNSNNTEFSTAIDYFYFSHKYKMDLQGAPILKSAISIQGNSEVLGMYHYQNIVGMQFHPEKSGVAGLALLSQVFDYYSKV